MRWAGAALVTGLAATWLPSCDGALVTSAIAVGNPVGLEVSYAVVKASRADGNSYGIDAASPAGDGGGNVAHGNLEEPECIKFVCS